VKTRIRSAGFWRGGGHHPYFGQAPAWHSNRFDAEYVALPQLHADALITLDRQLADAVKDLVTVAPIEALY
jgi:hypothetical protein